MSNKSGVASQVIPLPTGGGALQGIGETFAPDLFTGTGTFTVPLAVPPGRNGLQPALNLVYSTGNGNGPFGLGWALSTPEVTRKTSRGVPRYADDPAEAGARDVFLVSGAEDLVPVGRPSAGVTRFRPRTEGSFARIERIREGGDFWRVQGRDGLVSRYGAAGHADAVVADPQRASRVFCWKLTETTDPFGNRIAYDYRRDRGPGGARVWDQLYLDRIQYVDYEHNGEGRFLVSVTFVYEERPDPFSHHRAGFEVRTRMRCRRIEVRTHPVDADQLVRTYELVYLDDRVAAGELDPRVLPGNGVSLLSQVRVVGYDGGRTQALPPLEFRYSNFDPRGHPAQPVEGTGNTLPRRSLAHEDLELVDVFGNGLPDIVEMNGTTRYWRNLGNGMFDVPRSMPEVPAGVRLGDPGTQFGDLNGDGRADLLVLDRGGYFPLSFAGRWSPQGFVRYRSSPSVPFDDGNLRLVDLDGDGVVDALRTGSSFELFFNDPVDGWTGVETRPRGPIEEFPDVSFADPRVKLADLSGDGLQDIVLVEQGRIDYWPYLGHGRWGRRITMADSPVFRDRVLPPGRYDPRRVLVGDLDGDGLDDIVYIDADRVTIWINQSGNGWGEPITVDGTPRFTDIDAVRLVDLLGTGTAGILWTTDAGGSAAGTHRFIDLTGAVKPYLLEEMDNHQGARTRVRYATSTEFYLADAADPDTRWKTPLPFPVHVVAAVQVVDDISRGKLTTEYRYHHGYFDGAEREFRGFGMVEQRDTEVVDQDLFSPPLLLKTWFHLGPVGDEFAARGEADFAAEQWPGDPARLERPAETGALLRSLPASHRADALRALRGQVLRTELYALDGSDREDRPYTVTESQYGIRQEDPPAASAGDRRRVFFPHPVADRTAQWERGTEPMHQFGFTDAYDAYGMPGRQISLAVPRGRDFTVTGPPGEPYLGTSTVTTYARRDDRDRYLVDRVARTTTYEVRNDGAPALFDLLDAVRGGRRLAITGQALTYYDGEAFVGLPLGQIGEFGAAVRSDTLVLTEDVVRQAYRDQDGPAVPPYLVPGGPPAWTADYPQPFRDHLPRLAGYSFSSGDGDRERGYFVAASRQRYDFHDGRAGRGLPVATRDPLGKDTTLTYDRYSVLPVEVVDPAGLVTTASHDYRVFQPRLVTDPNGNRTAYVFTPLGLMASTAVLGKDGRGEGDTEGAPGIRLTYDFERQPIAVRTIRRVRHANDPGEPPADPGQTIETVEFSDGFGRLIQTRTQAEDVVFGDPTFGAGVVPVAQGDPATGLPVTGRPNGDRQRPNVVVNGWLVYDNKGRVVERYEPFLTTGWDYGPAAGAQLGQRMRTFYDPRGHAVRTVNPNGSEQRVCTGVPVDLADPGRFVPTPWEAYTYDPNDNAGRTHPGEADGYRHHWDTPGSIVLDALGRTVLTVERHRPAPANPSDAPASVEEFRTRNAYDIRGNLRGVTDAAGRRAFTYLYDLADRPLRTDSIDAGIRRTVLDAAGNAVEHRDGRGALILQAYDLLGRPIRQWARDDGASGVTLRERLEYGDGGDPGQPAAERAANRAANRLGALHRHYDEAGLLTFGQYDFKGSLLEKTRQVISSEAILAVFAAPSDPTPHWRVTAFRVDWQPPPGGTLQEHAAGLLDPTAYETSATHDALNRVTGLRYPRAVDGQRKRLRLAYNRAGLLEQATVDGQVFVERIAYNARGQRTLVAFGNGVVTRYAYDPLTFRRTRLRSERYTKPAPAALTYRPAGAPLQDLAYRHDHTGNVIGIVERTPACGVTANPDAGRVADPELRALLARGEALVRSFTYDSLYRLVAATGRECTGGAGARPWVDALRCGFNGAAHATPGQDNAPDLTGLYTEVYAYDRAGDLVRVRHAVGAAAAVRRYAFVAGTNRLRSLTAGETTFGYAYDDNGNMTGEGDSRHFEWDHRDQMKAFRTQAGTAEPSVHTHYLYDAGGQRIARLVRNQGGRVSITTYIDGVFEHHRWLGPGIPAGANNHLHVMDDQQRVALVRVGPPHPEDRGPAVQYHLSDHAGSSSVVVDGEGSFVNREEYTPYGDTSFGSFARRRYRFNGKERDEDSGLYYHDARYYAPWLGRWTSCDPGGLVDGPDLYRFTRNNPVNFGDPSGTQSEPTEGEPSPPPEDPVKRSTLRHGPGWFRDLFMPMVVGGRGPKAQRRLDSLGPDQSIMREVLENGWGCTACHLAKEVSGRLGPGAINPENNLPYDWALSRKGLANFVETSSRARFLVEGMTMIAGAKVNMASYEASMLARTRGPFGASEAEALAALRAESLPGQRVWLVGCDGGRGTRCIRIAGNRVTYDTRAPAGGQARSDMGAISNMFGLRGEGFVRPGAWWTGTHGTPEGRFGGPGLTEPKFYRQDRAPGPVYGWRVKNVTEHSPARILNDGLEAPTVYSWCYSSSSFQTKASTK